MGRGMQQPSPYGQLGDRSNFDPVQARAAFEQFRQDHPFPTNAGFPGSRPPVPMPPTTPPGLPPGPPAGDGGGPPSGFPGQGGGVEDGFPGGGATGGVFPGYPRGSTGDTTGRVGMGWGRIAGRNESGPGNALSKAFSAVGSSGANRPKGTST